jgi:phage-related protein
MLDEFALIKKVVDKVKDIGKNALNWVKRFFAKVMEKVKAVFEKIKNMGKKIFEAAFEFLGITISKATASVPKDIQGFIYGMVD